MLPPIGQRRSTWKIQPKNKWQWMQWWLKHVECTLYHEWLMLNATIHFRHRELVWNKQKKNTNYKKINTKSLTQTMAIHLACISSRRSKIIWRKKKITKQYERIDCTWTWTLCIYIRIYTPQMEFLTIEKRHKNFL